MVMSTKGIVVAPEEHDASTETWCTERVANRPVICHTLDALVSAGIADVAIVAPPRALADIRTCLEGDRGPGVPVRYLAQTGRPDLLGSLETAAWFVRDDPAVIHFADGLVGETPARFSRFLAEEPEGLRRRGQVEGDGAGQAQGDDALATLADPRCTGTRHGRNLADIGFPATGAGGAVAPPSFS